MQIMGVDKRAKDARAALNRLRWEIDQALERGHPTDAATMEVAEAVGIMANILAALGAALPESANAALGSERDRFVESVRYFTGYHRVPR